MSLLSLFVASLLGSLHCAAMCGGFAAFCGERRAGSLWAYNVGRLITYVTLGGIAGGAGDLLNQGLSGFATNSIAIVVGAILVFWGALRIFQFRRKELTQIGTPHGAWARIVEVVMRFSPVPRSLAVGISTTLLPCPWLYGFVALSAASGSALDGVIVMLVFWLGTLPILLSVGKISQALLARWGAQLPIITSALLIASGIFCIMGHIGIVSMHAGHEHQHHHHHADM